MPAPRWTARCTSVVASPNASDRALYAVTGRRRTCPPSQRRYVATDTCSATETCCALSPARSRNVGVLAASGTKSCGSTCRTFARRSTIRGHGNDDDVPRSHRDTRSPPATSTRRAS